MEVRVNPTLEFLCKKYNPRNKQIREIKNVRTNSIRNEKLTEPKNNSNNQNGTYLTRNDRKRIAILTKIPAISKIPLILLAISGVKKIVATPRNIWKEKPVYAIKDLILLQFCTNCSL